LRWKAAQSLPLPASPERTRSLQPDALARKAEVVEQVVIEIGKRAALAEALHPKTQRREETDD